MPLMPIILLLIVLGLAAAAYLYVKSAGDETPAASFDPGDGFGARSATADPPTATLPVVEPELDSPFDAPARGATAATAIGTADDELPPKPPTTSAADPVAPRAVLPPPSSAEPLVKARITAPAIDWTPPTAHVEPASRGGDDADDDSYLDRFTARSAPAYVPPLTDVGPASGQTPAVVIPADEPTAEPVSSPASEPATASAPPAPVAQAQAPSSMDTVEEPRIDLEAIEQIGEPTGEVIDLRDGDGAAAFARGASTLSGEHDAVAPDADADATPAAEVVEPHAAPVAETAEPAAAASTAAEEPETVIDLDALEAPAAPTRTTASATVEPPPAPAARFAPEADPIDQIIQALVDRARERRIAVADVAAELVEQAKLEDRAIDDVLADLVDRVDGAARTADELTLYSDAAPRRPGRLSQLENMDSQEKKRVIVRVLCLLVASRAEDAELATVGAATPTPAAEPEPAPSGRSWPGPRPGGRRVLPERRLLRGRR